jgi:hypothetical protein
MRNVTASPDTTAELAPVRRLVEDLVRAFDLMCTHGYAQDGQVRRFVPRHDKWRRSVTA